MPEQYICGVNKIDIQYDMAMERESEVLIPIPGDVKIDHTP